MEDIKLSYEARKIFGRYLGINDEKSPLLKSDEDFYDRLHLFEPFIYLRKLIEAYNKDLSKYNSEEEYIELINNSSQSIADCVEAFLDYTLSMEDYDVINTFNQKAIYNNIDNKLFLNKHILEIKPSDDIYDILKYKDKENNLPDSVSEFIMSITDESDYIILREDLCIEYMDDFFKDIIALYADELSVEIADRLSTVINKKQIISCHSGRVYILMPTITSLEVIDSIVTQLEEIINVSLEIGVFELKELSPESDLLCKKYNDGRIELINGTAVDISLYLRFLAGEKIKKNDLLFEIDGVTCRMSRNPSLKWIDIRENIDGA